jgi:hypothetical protein
MCVIQWIVSSSDSIFLHHSKTQNIRKSFFKTIKLTSLKYKNTLILLDIHTDASSYDILWIKLFLVFDSSKCYNGYALNNLSRNKCWSLLSSAFTYHINVSFFDASFNFLFVDILLIIKSLTLKWLIIHVVSNCILLLPLILRMRDILIFLRSHKRSEKIKNLH